MPPDVSSPARTLAASLEAFAAQVYFAPECHSAYEKLGFGPSPATKRGIALPDGPAYFCSRGSLLGQVPGELVAAAFGVFNPAVVIPAVTYGWTLTDAKTICAARTEGSIGHLTRILGPKPDGLDRANELLKRATDGLRPEGRPLFAGLLADGLPGEPLADAWRLADRLREYRGDAHIASWTSAGFDATEIGLLTEYYWGVPPRSYIRTRAWSDSDMDAAAERLASRGLLDGGEITDAGRTAREAVEISTDGPCRRIVENLGDDLPELARILKSWSSTVQAVGGYPGSGPHDLAAVGPSRG